MASDEPPQSSVFGAIVAALFAVARRPTLATFAARMQTIEPGWIVPMMMVSIGLDALNATIGSIVQMHVEAHASHHIFFRFGAPTLLDRLIYSLITYPLTELLSLVIIVYVTAALMPVAQGSLQQRAFQIARLYLLAFILNGILYFVLGVIENPLRLTGLDVNPFVYGVTSLIEVTLSIYMLVAFLNALAAGSGKSRWLLFGILALSQVVGFIVDWYVLGFILFRIGIHLPVSL